jgi:hypothetical protein
MGILSNNVEDTGELTPKSGISDAQMMMMKK